VTLAHHGGRIDRPPFFRPPPMNEPRTISNPMLALLVFF
jgi:hypothetical protein